MRIFALIAFSLLITVNLINPVTALTDYKIPPLPREKHPFVYYTAEEWHTIKDKINRQPYKSWFEQLTKNADSYLANPDTEIDQTEKMKRAKELAFLYSLFRKSDYAELTVKYLFDFQDNPPFIQGDNYPIKYARVLFDGCAAYDLLHIYLQSRPETNNFIREKLAKGAQASYDFTPFWYSHHKNNWGIRQYAGLGLAALVLADGVAGFEPEKWWIKAEKNLDEHFRFQITPNDGGFAEGYSYLAYSADLYLPYSRARWRITGNNLLDRDYLKMVHQWAVDVMVPNGKGPMFDDSKNARFQFEQLCLDSGDTNIYRWAYLKSGGNHAGINLVDAICNYSDYFIPHEPEFPSSRFLPEAGNMVFRSDWSDDAVWGIFLGEYGQARTASAGHEHNDVGSFHIYAYGEWILLDGGYGTWDTNKRTNTPENHNMILVDGKGPASLEIFGERIHAFGDGYLSNYQKHEKYEYCEIHTSYNGCNIVRSVYFIENDTFLIFDRIDSDNIHELSLPFHINGGFETGGTFTETINGATLERDNVKVRIEIFPLCRNYSFTSRSDEHAIDSNDFQKHQVREATMVEKDVSIITLISISQVEMPSPALPLRNDSVTVLKPSGNYSITYNRSTLGLDITFH